jgi:hypothetical protein
VADEENSSQVAPISDVISSFIKSVNVNLFNFIAVSLGTSLIY